MDMLRNEVRQLNPEQYTETKTIAGGLPPLPGESEGSAFG